VFLSRSGGWASIASHRAADLAKNTIGANTLTGLVFAYTVVRTGGSSGAVGGPILLALSARAIWPRLPGWARPSWLSGPVATIRSAVATA
jgi:hypothetical protein